MSSNRITGSSAQLTRSCCCVGAGISIRANPMAILDQALSDAASFNAALKPALDWARKERPQELSEIYPDGKFIYNTQMAKRWLTLLRDWREAARIKQ